MHAIPKSTAYHPVLQLVFLILIAIAGALVFSFIGFIGWVAFNVDHDTLSKISGNPADMDINLLRVLQISSSTGLFIAGPIAFAYFNQVKPKSYFYFNQKLSWKLVALVILIMFLSNPVFELTAIWNQNMVLPDFLKDIEIWMRLKETEAALLTKKLLIMNNYGDLTLNLLMIAIIPAIGEELFFRGGMQNILQGWFKNHHYAIWITGIVFSAIHVQFFGFFPRMLLGVLFGYLLVYGKSIWLPILGHFLNNGSAVVMAYIMQKQGKTINEIEKSTSFDTYAYIISAIITLVLLVLYFKQAKKENITTVYE
jgi:membrane protease YdiL (CAAX protease family)